MNVRKYEGGYPKSLKYELMSENRENGKEKNGNKSECE
jgi:hypothetical protein